MKRLFAAAAALLLGTSLASSADYPAPVPLKDGAQASLDKLAYKSGPITIAYLPMGTEFNYHVAIFEGIKQAVASATDVKTFMLSPYSGSDQQGQMGMLQDVTARKDVDAIILISFDEHALAPLVKEAEEAGKAVILVNSDIPNFPTPINGVVGVNQRAANHALTDWARKAAKDEPRKAGVIEGEPSYLSTERTGGFLDGIKGTNWPVVASINGGWSVEKGNTAAMDLLQGHSDIQVLYAANDYMALGAALAGKALGRTDLTILGYDGDTGALENIANGEGITATTNTSPVVMGRAAADFAIDILRRKVPGGYVNTPATIVTKDNAVQVLHNAEDLYPKPSKTY